MPEMKTSSKIKSRNKSPHLKQNKKLIYKTHPSFTMNMHFFNGAIKKVNKVL